MRFIKTKEQLKLYENISLAKKILKDNGKDETYEPYLYLRDKLKNNTGYIGWFTKMSIESNIKKDEIDWLIDIIKNDKFLISSLSKDLIKYDNFELLVDDILAVNNERKLKSLLSEIPSSIRRIIDPLSKSEIELLERLSKNEDKSNFISKVSRYKTKEEFMDSLKIFLSSNIKSYQEVIDSIKKVDAKLEYYDPSHNIVICGVNYQQIRVLGSDTSWCIVPSKSTFDSYVSDYNRQYIIFLTDRNDNYSKIGATIGFKPKAQHLKDDTHISYSKLRDIILERGFELNSLVLDIDKAKDIININDSSVSYILSLGISLDYILDNKQKYTERDLLNFTQEKIDEFNLNDKIEIKNFSDFKRKFKTNILDKLIENSTKLSFKLTMVDILEINPSPMSLDELRPIMNKYAIESIDKILEYKYKPLELIKKLYNFYKFKYEYNDFRGRVNTEDDVKYTIYALNLCSVFPYNVDKNELLENISLSSSMYIYDYIAIYQHFIRNGYDFTADELFNKLKISIGRSSIRNKSEDILILLKNFPILKELVKDEVIKYIGKTHFYSTELDTIKDNYPDYYEYAVKSSNGVKICEDLLNLSIFSNFSKSESYIKNNVISKGDTLNSWLNRLYDESIVKLKDFEVSSTKIYYLIVVVLLKLGKINELSDFKFNWTYIYGIFVDIYFKKFNVISAPELQLSDSELEEYLNIINIMDYPFENIKKFKALQVVYYIKNWGFNIYMRMVKNDDDGYKISYFYDIFSYLSSKGNLSEAKSIVDEVLSWMSKDDIKAASPYINTHNMDKFGDSSIIVNYIRDKIK